MWGGADQQQAAAIVAALDHGVTLIDTAPIYGFGRSRQIVGQAIRGRRDKVVLATKCGLIWDRVEGELHFHANADGITADPSEKAVYKCLRPESIREGLHASLKRLQTDYVDLYQTHWQTSTTPVADTMAALMKLKEEGKIRAIGVSNANVEHLKQVQPDRFGPGTLQHARPRHGNPWRLGLLSAAQDLRACLLAAGQRPVDRKTSP